MSLRWRPVLIVAATAGLVAAGGSIAAFANWSTPATRTTVTVEAREVPTLAAPQVRLIGRPFVSWNATNLLPGVRVHQYVVTRHVGTASTVVCEVPVLLTTCVDWLPPVNTRMTYSVHATFRRWAGDASERSDSVRVPRGLAAPSAATVAGLTANGTTGSEAPLSAGASAPGKATPPSGQKAATAPGTAAPETAQPGATQEQPDATPSADAQLGTAPPATTEPEKTKPGSQPAEPDPQGAAEANSGHPAGS
jgi:hypothetical protein